MNVDKKQNLAHVEALNRTARSLGEQQKALADASAKLADEEKKKVRSR